MTLLCELCYAVLCSAHMATAAMHIKYAGGCSSSCLCVSDLPLVPLLQQISWQCL